MCQPYKTLKPQDHKNHKVKLLMGVKHEWFFFLLFMVKKCALPSVFQKEDKVSVDSLESVAWVNAWVLADHELFSNKWMAESPSLTLHSVKGWGEIMKHDMKHVCDRGRSTSLAEGRKEREIGRLMRYKSNQVTSG